MVNLIFKLEFMYANFENAIHLAALSMQFKTHFLTFHTIY